MKAYPNVKVILTTRDPSKWYQSYKNTVYRCNKDWLKDSLMVLGQILLRRRKFILLGYVMHKGKGDKINLASN